MSERHTIKCHLYPGQDDALIAWVAELDALPFGGKSQAIKAALRRALEGQPTPEPVAAALDVDTLLDTLLPAIRRVVEAAVTTALAQGSGSWNAPGAAHAGTPGPDADFLNALDANLLLEEDDAG